MAKCPCGSNKEYSECCEPVIQGRRPATSPEELMRSRYAAYVHKEIDYLLESLDPQARFDWDRKSTEDWANAADFTGLEIVNSTNEGNKGTVEFKAHFKMEVNPGEGKTEHTHHEISKFRKQAGVWYFRDGKVVPPPQAKTETTAAQKRN